MLEAAIPAFLAAFHTWLTPTVLFVLLNVVIGTIAVTSKISRREDDTVPSAADDDTVGPKLSRSSSAVLHRIRSFNLHLHFPTDKPLEPPPPLPPSPATDPNVPDPAPKDLSAGEAGEIDQHLCRSHSAEEIETKLSERMKKSASEKPAFDHFEEAMTLRHADSILGEDSEEVDARANDFINRFRQQLKLQQLDSATSHKGDAQSKTVKICQN